MEPRSGDRVTILEMLFILYTSFGVGWFFNNFISFELGKYVFATYLQLFALTSWLCLVVIRLGKISRLTVPVLIVLGAVLSIESYHVWRLGTGAGNVTGIKAILYNSMYGSLINLVVLVLVLHHYQSRRSVIVHAIVAAATWLTALGITMWGLVYSGLVLPIATDSAAAVQILNNNTGAYVSCFVVYFVHFTSLGAELSPRRRLCYTAVTVASVLLYTSRGAMLLLLGYAALVALRGRPSARLAVGTAGALAAVAVLVVAVRTDTAAEYYTVFAAITEYMQRLEQVVGPLLQFKDVELTDLTRDRPTDALISSVGRVFSGLIAMRIFGDNAALGVGTYTAYSVEAYGTGIHSLTLLYAASSGVAGLLLLILLFALLGRRRRFVVRHHLLYLLPMGLFLNLFPLWYACFFLLEGVRKRVPVGEPVTPRHGEAILRTAR